MKMLNKVCSVILVAAFLAAMFTVNVFALEEDYKYSTIAYFDGSGERVNAILAGETLTAKVRAKHPFAGESLMFTMLLYQNNKLIDAECDTQIAGDTATEYSATMTMPDDLTGVQVVSILWDNMKGMNAVCQSSIFPGGPADVNMIYLDGEPLAGFDPEVYEYTYPIEIDRVYAPVITCDLLDASAEYDVELSKFFPGSSTITVTSGDGSEEKVYTINYECNETLAEVISGSMHNNEGLALPSYNTNLSEDQKAIVNRDVYFSYVDSRIQGYDWLSAVAWIEEMTFTINRPATIAILLDEVGWNKPERDNLLNDGWNLEKEPVVNMTSEELDSVKEDTTPELECDNRKQGWAYVDWRALQPTRNHSFCGLSEKYSKHFDKGAEIPVKEYNLSGDGAYGGIILLQYDPMVEVTDTSDIDLEWDYDGPTGITSITVGGEAIPNFDYKTYDYTVAIDPSLTTPPEVVCEVVPGASYEVSVPETYPGSVEITVEDMNGFTEVYTLNYTTTPVTNIKLADRVVDANIWNVDESKYTYGTNYQLGVNVFADRTYVTEYIDESLLGLPYLTTTLGQSGADAWNAVGEDWLSFDLARPATMHIIKLYENQALVDLGYTMESVDIINNQYPNNNSQQGYIYLNYNKNIDDTDSGLTYSDNQCAYHYKYSKYFEPGTVEIPALGGSDGWAVFFEFDGWE